MHARNFSYKDAIALKHDLKLTKSQMRSMKSYLHSKRVHFPKTTDLLEPRRKLHPTMNRELGGDGVSINYLEPVESTSAILINEVSTTVDSAKPVTVVYKDGGDGAGSQTVWDSVSMTDAADHILK